MAVQSSILFETLPPWNAEYTERQSQDLHQTSDSTDAMCWPTGRRNVRWNFTLYNSISCPPSRLLLLRIPFDVNVRYALVVDVDDGSLQIRRHHFYRATRMHSADDAVARCPSVCLSVCHTPVFRLNDYTYPQFISLSRSPTILVFPYQTGWQYSDGDPLTGASNAKGYEKNRGFRPICLFVSETSEWPLNQISRSRCYSTSNNSKTVQDRAMFTMAHQ